MGVSLEDANEADDLAPGLHDPLFFYGGQRWTFVSCRPTTGGQWRRHAFGRLRPRPTVSQGTSRQGWTILVEHFPQSVTPTALTETLTAMLDQLLAQPLRGQMQVDLHLYPDRDGRFRPLTHARRGTVFLSDRTDANNVYTCLWHMSVALPGPTVRWVRPLVFWPTCRLTP